MSEKYKKYDPYKIWEEMGDIVDLMRKEVGDIEKGFPNNLFIDYGQAKEDFEEFYDQYKKLTFEVKDSLKDWDEVPSEPSEKELFDIKKSISLKILVSATSLKKIVDNMTPPEEKGGLEGLRGYFGEFHDKMVNQYRQYVDVKDQQGLGYGR